MRVDTTTVLAILLVFVGLFFAVTASNLYTAGIISSTEQATVLTSGLYILALALAYLVYHGVYDMSRNIQSYEYADRRKTLAFVIAGLFLLFLPTFARHLPASPALAQLLVSVLGLAPVFIAIAENYGYIGVIADYIYDKTKNPMLTAMIAPIPAVAMHASLPLLVPGYNLFYLYLFFAYWTFASIESHSTLPADILHVLDNSLYLLLR